MRQHLLLLCAAVLLAAGCADARPPLRTVAHVDLQRYAGTWYVIANIPYWLEDGKVATADRYGLRPDGLLDNTYVFRRGDFTAPEEEWHGRAWVVNEQTNAEWNVRFVWPFSATYLVIDLDPEYRWAAVGHPSRDYFWVLSRERSLPPATYQAILARAAAQGYDISRVALVPQPAAQTPASATVSATTATP